MPPLMSTKAPVHSSLVASRRSGVHTWTAIKGLEFMPPFTTMLTNGTHVSVHAHTSKKIAPETAHIAPAFIRHKISLNTFSFNDVHHIVTNGTMRRHTKTYRSFVCIAMETRPSAGENCAPDVTTRFTTISLALQSTIFAHAKAIYSPKDEDFTNNTMLRVYAHT